VHRVRGVPLPGSAPWTFTDASKAYFFPVGVKAVPAVQRPPISSRPPNTIGLPRYAKQAVGQQFARWVMLHV
jgi:hypothetical protein